MVEARDVTITRLGAQGDGIVDDGGTPLYVPFALSGERVRVSVSGERARVIDILAPSRDRVAPVCRHFGTCGGCAMQHMALEAYRAWKREIVVAAFATRGIDAPVADLETLQGKRRRASVTARKARDGLVLGFHEAGSHDLVAISECPVLENKIVAALPGLRALVEPLVSARNDVRMTVTATNGGLDVAIEEIAKSLTAGVRAQLASHATHLGLARLSIAGDPVFQALPPALTFGPADVIIPPGVFVQAVADAEARMAALIVTALGKVKMVVDLFCGVGAFTFPLAARAKVLAFDSDAAAIAAVIAGAKTARGVKPIAARVRDLYSEPLSALELNETGAVIFDPPRAGADAQSRMIGKSKVKTVIAVSCNPATLARDARTLIDGGYKLEAVTPIDQFRYTPHVEAVAVFRR